MKSNIIALLGAATAFLLGGLFAVSLPERRHTGGSFRELYRDNAEALKGGETDD